MSTQQQSSAESGPIGWLAGNRSQGGLLMMIAGIVLAAVTTWLAAQYGNDLIGIEIMIGLLAVLFLFAGVILRFRPPGAGSPADEARFTVLALGGLVGLCIAILGLILNVQYWDRLTAWLRLGDRDGAWKALLAIVTLVAGLAVMFLSLSSARSEERSSPVLRRLIYGYNAILTGILLFLILAIVNVLAYMKLPAMVDSTEAGLFKLSDRSKQILQSLDKPTTVYLIMASDGIAFDEMRTLLANAQDFAPYLRVESLSPGLNAGRIRELQKQYPDISSEGVLVVYGDGPNAPGSFIKSEDILKVNFTGRDRSDSFEGEAKLMTDLAFLSENRQKPIVYFANQNAGEFDLNDTDPRKVTGIGSLKSRLEKRNFDVRPLKFDTADPKVPDDATIIVLPNPRQPYTQPVVAALTKYMNERKGKLVLLTDIPQRATAMPETGLEPLLSAYKVDLGKDRVLMVPVQVGQSVYSDPEVVLGTVAQSAVAARNPVAVSFDGYNLRFAMSRVVRPMAAPAAPGQGDPSLRAETLLETSPGLPVWAESDLKTAPRQMVESFFKDTKLFREKRSPEPLPIAVVVGESAAPMPGGAGAAAKPRMAVFGSASFISNPYMDETRSDPVYFDLFAGTLEWLRERPSNVGIEPRTYKNYMLDPGTNLFRLVFLPSILALTCIIGLGVGVWVVRRR